MEEPKQKHFNDIIQIQKQFVHYSPGAGQAVAGSLLAPVPQTLLVLHIHHSLQRMAGAANGGASLHRVAGGRQAPLLRAPLALDVDHAFGGMYGAVQGDYRAR